ncbi:MAG: CbtA family protein [Gammaproteobacteria bacterium]|nr:CbtA family protein [Gammaproteobacteria bacterium]
MFQRIFFAAIVAGLLAGALISGVQSVTTTPIILHAEENEGGGQDHSATSPGVNSIQLAVFDAATGKLLHRIGESAPAANKEEGWAPEDGLERTLYTTLANLLIGTGFSLLVVAGMVLSGRPVKVGTGVLWGAAGFVVFTLAPGLGLPPEVPGSMAAELGARQSWWIFAAAGAALGLGLMVFADKLYWKAVGIVVMVLPHLVGAPHPASIGGAVPPELAGQFAATAIVVSAIFWVMIGGFSAAFYRRLG